MSKSRFPLILMLALSITPVISVYFPRFLAFWPLIIGFGTSYWFIFFKKELFHISRLYYFCAGVISILCLLSVIWSISPMQSIEDAFKVTALLMFGGLLVSSFKALEIEDFKSYGWLFPAGVLIAAMLCAFDLCNNLVIYKIFHNFDVKTNTSVMNRGIICCVFAYFLSLPLIQYLNWNESRKFLLTAVTGIMMVIMLFLSQSQTGQLVFAIGLVLFFTFPVRWRMSYILLGLGLFAAMLTTPIIVSFLYDYLVIDYEETNFWIREAYIGNRVEIWFFVMKYAVNNPLYGYGIEATNYVSHFDFAHIYNEKNTVLHPHNFSVQIWMEFGLLGIVVATGILNALLYALYHIEDLPVRKTLTVLFIVTLLVSSMTYGLWQSWLLGEFLFMLGFGAFLSNMHASSAMDAEKSEDL
ncbi:MAG: O-antigen ligase family protein [Alphaproteobacteria bacterium]|nr:O-antigen ligase family protein [Alphaproteobacteria bacterium]